MVVNDLRVAAFIFGPFGRFEKRFKISYEVNWDRMLFLLLTEHKHAVLLVSRVGIDNLLWRMLRTEGYVLVEHLAADERMQTRIAHVLCVIIL